MTVYIIMIFLTISLARIQHRVKRKIEKKFIFALTILLPTLVAAFRYDDSGTDYIMYSNIFKKIGLGGNGITVSFVTGKTFTKKTLEVGFFWLVKICQMVTTESWFTFGVIALIMYFFVFKTCLRHSTDYLISILLFFITAIYFDSFNGLRQYLAMAVFFYGFRYIESENLKKYLLVCLVACLFHKSIIFVIPIYFLQYLKFDLKKAVSIIAISVIGGAAIYKIVLWGLLYTPYAYFLTSVELKEAVASTNQIILFGVNTILSFISLKFLHKNGSDIDDSVNNFFYNTQTIGTVVTLLTMFVPLAARLQGYFMLYEILFIPYYLRAISEKKTRTFIGLWILLMYLVINIWGICFKGWYGCYPYQTIFSRY